MKILRFILLLLSSLSLFSQEKLLFLHIPKTGGITVYQFIQEHYYFHEYGQLHWTCFEEEKELLNEKSFIKGHLFNFQLNGLDGEFKKITFLRDPVRRILSVYRYLNYYNSEEAYLHFVSSPEEAFALSNIACKMLSGLDPNDERISIEEHFIKAKEALEKEFFFVGITEKMEDSLSLLVHKMGWPPTEEIAYHNTTEKFYTDYPEELVEEIRQRNLADIELYAFALELYEKQKSAILAMPQEPISHHWTNSIDYLFDAPLPGWGWCNREAVDGDVFRWMGYPEKTALSFDLLPNTNYTLEIDAKFSQQVESQFQMMVNGFPIAHKIVQTPGSVWQIIQAEIPAKYIIPGRPTRLHFEIIDPKRPYQKDYYCGRCGFRRVGIFPSE